MKAELTCFFTPGVLALMLTGICGNRTSYAATFGIDNVHGFDANATLATGIYFTTFRSVITGLGHTIVPLNSFGAASLTGLDAVILNTPYSQNGHSYSASEIAAVNAFANQRAAFVSDSNTWSTVGDRPITFGDNQRLLENAISYTSSGGAAIYLGDDGSGFNALNMNALVAAYGVSYSTTPTDGAGRTITGFVAHPVTAGLTQIGVDFQLPMTINSPSLHLTIGGGQDNVLAVYAVPEPMAALIVSAAGTMLVLAGMGRLRRDPRH
jgi:hypothetical protein